MGWLKDRIERERRIRDGAPDLWDLLTKSIAVSVQEWRQVRPGDVSIDPRSEQYALMLSKRRNLGITIWLDQDVPCVKSTQGSIKPNCLGFGLAADGLTVVFEMDGKPIDVEMAARLITEPIFES